MHIFIDESGTFRRDDKKEQSVSCVGAIVIPGRYLSDVEARVRLLSANWPKAEDGELKGRLLSEEHFIDLCNVLEPLHVLMEVSVMDMNLAGDSDVAYHQRMQAEGMTSELTPMHHPNAVAHFWELRRLLEKMAPQLYAQAAAMTDVVRKACEVGKPISVKDILGNSVGFGGSSTPRIERGEPPMRRGGAAAS